MRAVVAGYGFLGAQIVQELAAAGFETTVLRRSAVSLGIQFAAVDLTVQPPQLSPRDFDVAVFCLAPGQRNPELYEKTYVTAQRNFLAGVQAHKYIYISSTAVYADAAGTYDETQGSAHTSRAEILLAAEAVALSHPGGCVLRLAGLYHKERPIYGKRSSTYEEDKLVHFIHRDDAARAVLQAVQNNLHGIYNVHDGNPQWRSAILRRLGLSADFAPGTERRITHEKFFGTGFRPAYADYFAGAGLEQRID